MFHNRSKSSRTSTYGNPVLSSMTRTPDFSQISRQASLNNKRKMNQSVAHQASRKALNERLNEVRESLLMKDYPHNFEPTKHTSRSAVRWNARYKLDNSKLLALQCGQI